MNLKTLSRIAFTGVFVASLNYGYAQETATTG